MNYLNDAKDLIEHSQNKLIYIKRIYEESLNKKEVDRFLLIEIKNFMENLRSALDYSAHGLFDKFDIKVNGNIYFPYAKLEANSLIFEKYINKKISRIKLNKPDIYAKLESYQHFSSPHNTWLPKFMDLNNKNKHVYLVPQVKVEYKELTMNITGGPTIILKNNASLNIKGDILINKEKFSGRQINAENPFEHKDIKNEVKTWISFNFSINNEPVLPLLESALNGVDKIVSELSKL